MRVCKFMCVCHLVIEPSGCVCLFQIALLSSELLQCVSVSSTPTGMVWLVCVLECVWGES